jgi:xanthine dehydrogenase iron-sulfur cluster and FAD-binding subunit A
MRRASRAPASAETGTSPLRDCSARTQPDATRTHFSAGSVRRSSFVPTRSTRASGTAQRTSAHHWPVRQAVPVHTSAYAHLVLDAPDARGVCEREAHDEDVGLRVREGAQAVVFDAAAGVAQVEAHAGAVHLGVHGVAVEDCARSAET